MKALETERADSLGSPERDSPMTATTRNFGTLFRSSVESHDGPGLFLQRPPTAT
jgi:hypothetical protein